MEKHGVKLGFMSAFIKASAYALQEVPAVNGGARACAWARGARVAARAALRAPPGTRPRARNHGRQPRACACVRALPLTPVRARACVRAVIDGDDIVYRDYIDVSIAVATPKGLVVPVLRNVEGMNFAGCEKVGPPGAGACARGGGGEGGAAGCRRA